MLWLKLYPDVPECGQYSEDDLDTLAEWFFDFELVNTSCVEDFKVWLKHLPLGVICSVPSKDGYKIVRLESTHAQPPYPVVSNRA